MYPGRNGTTKIRARTKAMYKAHDARACGFSWFDISPFVVVNVNEDGEAKDCWIPSSSGKPKSKEI
jgi:hypothetical protein